MLPQCFQLVVDKRDKTFCLDNGFAIFVPEWFCNSDERIRDDKVATVFALQKWYHGHTINMQKRRDGETTQYIRTSIGTLRHH